MPVVSLIQSRINLGHFWSIVFSHATKTAIDVYNDISFLFHFYRVMHSVARSL